MKVLLVYPAYPDTFWSFKHVLPFVSKKAAFPPLGAMTVASMLPREWEKRLVDLNVRELRDEDIAWADMVMISAMIVQEKSAITVMERAKALGKTVVAGGPAFGHEQDRFPLVDHFIVGEAEEIVHLFTADVAEGRAKRIYECRNRPDIALTPAPMWELIDFKDYASMCLQYSRGCPFDCEFCSIVSMNGRVPRVKSTDQMLAEMQSLYDAGWRQVVFIVDDNFIGNKAKTKHFLRALIEWQKERGYPYRLMTEVSINLARDEELMKLMSRANFHKVFVGIESPSTESLNECGKKQNTACDPVEAIRAITRHGMQVMGGFIVGFDSDTESIFESQIRFIREIGVVAAMVGVLSAIPNTRLWQRLKAENRLVEEELSGDNTDGGALNFIPNMGRETLLSGYKYILDTIYSTRQYYQRINTFLAHYKPTVRSRLSMEELKALVKSFWHIGVASRARFSFWKLMAKTTLTKPKALPAAVELAIWGRHFERMARRVSEPTPD